MIGFRLAFNDGLQEVGVYAGVRLDSKERAIRNKALAIAKTRKQEGESELEDI